MPMPDPRGPCEHGDPTLCDECLDRLLDEVDQRFAYPSPDPEDFAGKGDDHAR